MKARHGNGNGHGKSLAVELRRVASGGWGEYQDRVTHHSETFGRTPPLAGSGPRVAEWMMGLTDGWVTGPDVGLPLYQQSKILGNGVVPLQAVIGFEELARRAGVDRLWL